MQGTKTSNTHTQLHEIQEVTRQTSHDKTSPKTLPANLNGVQLNYDSLMIHTMKPVGEQYSSNGATSRIAKKKAKRDTPLDLVLPGIEGFLKDVLRQESLSDEGEELRRFYVKILENTTENSTDIIETFDINKNDPSPLKTPPITGSCFTYDDEGTSEDKLLDRQDYSKERQASKEPVSNVPRQDRKGTDSTEESGVFFNSHYASSGGQEVSNPRHSDTFESTSSRDTFLSDSDFELLEWENDSIVNEDGYCTEDNLENSVQNMQFHPNEFGEIYSGVLYIREQPGWHKRWFTVTERCMKCYKYKTDDKMLFEIPLRDGKFVSTDRKRSRMFPMTLSIARLKDSITFATTEEKSRQEWIFVINHVMNKLAENPSESPSPVDIKDVPFSSLLRAESLEERRGKGSSSENFPEHSKTHIVETRSESLKRKTWHAGVDNGFEDVMNQWRVKGEDETDDMEPPSLAQEESFKELQECLPDILQRPKSKSWRGDLENNHLPSSKKGLTGPGSTQNRKNITFNAEVENKQSSNSDLTNVPRVKRHGSLANSLTNKAARVRSKLTTSFFKKGKKEERVYQQAESQNTIFSGYLIRKKGNVWKNRWCVVKNHSLYCFKEFGAPLAELELTLFGCGVKTLPEGEGEKPFMFVLTADKEQLYFAVENDAELEEWLVVLENEARRADKEDDEINIYPTDSLDGAMLTTLSSPDSPQESHKLFEPQPETTEEQEKPQVTKRTHSFTRTSKETPQTQGPKRSSLLGALAHKLAKQSSKSKVSTDSELDDKARRELQPNEIENLVLPDQQSQTEAEKSITENGPTMKGTLYYRPVDTWLKSKVNLQNHSLDIEPEIDFTDSIKQFETLKFRLVNCLVLDCTDTEGPLIMVVKRAIGQPLYLRAETEEDYIAWKDAISSAILTTSLTKDRLLSSESGCEGDDSCTTATPSSSKISGDSFDRDDVFFKDITVQEHLVNHNPEPHPSPRATTAGDVSSESSVDDHHSKARVQIKRAYSAGGIDRIRSLSEGYLVHSKKRQSPLRRTISNALTILDLSSTKRRRKTFGGLGVNASLLIGIKYTSCLYFRVNKGPWSERWCVLQQNNLHFFKDSEDIYPCSTMKLEDCVVKKTSFKGKKFAFVVKLPLDKKQYCFSAESERELDIWIRLLQAEGDVQRPNENPLATFDLLNGVLPKIKSEGNINNASRPDVAVVDEKKVDSTKKMRKMSKSLNELRKIREAGDKKDLFKDSNGSSMRSSSTITRKPTSLQEVLLLLQEQQRMQSMGHQRYARVTKARGNWKKSAAAVLRGANSQPESPEFPKKHPDVKEKKEKIETVPQEKPRGSSTGSVSSKDYANVLSSYQTSVEYLGKCDKLAEEEKLKALKTETLLRKRRNSLNLEKGALQKKLEKTHEKKGAVKKLLAKDVVKNKEEIIRDQKRLEEINLKLAHVDKDMRENRSKEAAVMENLTALKTNPRPRRSSENYESLRSSIDATTRSVQDERRAKFRESPTGSISSRDSFDDKNELYRPSVPESGTSLPRKGSKKKCQASLLVLEEELQKISPNVSRRKKYGSGKRVSSSSEGSFDDSSFKESPGTSRQYSNAPEEKRESITSVGSQDSQDKNYGWDNVELKRKRYSGSLPTLANTDFHSVAVSIPTTSTTDDTDAPPVSNEHRPSLITALSQIKDFEEFLKIHRSR